MKETKNEIKYLVTLNEEQKEAKRLILNNQVVIITGRAGSGKSLVCAVTALDLLFKKTCKKIVVTRALVEVGNSMGFLPGTSGEKFNPYMEAFKENLYSCVEGANKIKVDTYIKEDAIAAFPVQFARGKTIDDILVIEEAQNLSKTEMLALLTRLGKHGKIIINGDNDQKDTKDTYTGLTYATELSKHISGIGRINLKENHRSDIVGKILDYEYKG